MTNRRPRFAVVYDVGSAGPGEIATGLRALGDVIFVVLESDFTRPRLPLIREFGDVLLMDEGELTLDALRKRAPDAILTFCEHLIRQTARFAADLDLPFHSPETADVLTDKWRQRSLLNAKGVGSVRSRRLSEPGHWPAVAAQVGLPAVLKPVRGAGSRNTFKVSDLARGSDLVRTLLGPPDPPEREIVVEEFLAGRDCAPFGDYVSVESAVHDGNVVHLAVTGKFPLIPPFRELGHIWPAPLDAAELAEVRHVTSSALHALGVATGITHTEIKRTDHGPRVIEVNGRMGGNIQHIGKHAAGVDVIEVAGRLALGEEPSEVALPPGRVTFLYNNPAPPVPCTLEAIHGAADVRRMPGVLSYRTVVRAGRETDGGVRTQWLDILVGAAEDHQEMLDVLDEALDALAFTFRLPYGRVRLDAHSLRSLTAEMLRGGVERFG